MLDPHVTGSMFSKHWLDTSVHHDTRALLQVLLLDQENWVAAAHQREANPHKQTRSVQGCHWLWGILAQTAQGAFVSQHDQSVEGQWLVLFSTVLYGLHFSPSVQRETKSFPFLPATSISYCEVCTFESSRKFLWPFHGLILSSCFQNLVKRILCLGHFPSCHPVFWHATFFVLSVIVLLTFTSLHADVSF